MAWKEFRRGKSKKPDVQEFEFNLEDNLFSLREELLNKNYEHNSYEAFYVRDPKLRHIHKASVRDRVVHQAIFKILYQIFDKSFVFDTYSCRKNKGAHKAIRRFKVFAGKISKNNSKTIFILKCDIKKFFDSINQEILMDIIKNKIADNDALWLLDMILKSFEKDKERGLPLGNVTSQLFANIYLNEFDKFIKKQLKIKYYIRYCDDFVILHCDKNFLINTIVEINNFLIQKLGLRLHDKKIVIRKYYQGIDFLGYVIRPQYIILRAKTKKRILKKIIKNKGGAKQSIQSYLGILKHCRGYIIGQKIKKISNTQ